MMGAYNRDVSRRKALRKKRLSEEVCWNDYYDNLHQFSKNKIHCSCPMCSEKTRNKGRRGRKNYCRSVNYKKSDFNKQAVMDEKMYEYNGIKIHRRPPTY